MFSKKIRDAWNSAQDASHNFESLWKLIVDVDRAQVRQHIVQQRARHPQLPNDALLEKIYEASKRNAMTAGFIAGLPGGLIAIPAAVAELYALVRIESFLIGCVACLHRPTAFAAENFGMHIAIIMGGRQAIDQILKTEKGVKNADQVQGTWRVVNGVLMPGRMDTLKRILQACIRNRLLLRASSRSVPLLGGAIGAAFNWREIRLVLADAHRYFEL